VCHWQNIFNQIFKNNYLLGFKIYIIRNSQCTVSMVTIRISIDFMLIKCVNAFIKIRRKKSQWQMVKRKVVHSVCQKECIDACCSFCGWQYNKRTSRADEREILFYSMFITLLNSSNIINTKGRFIEKNSTRLLNHINTQNRYCYI